MTPTNLRLAALKRFALAITILNIAGHLFLGFEPSWAQPIVAIITAYSLELLFEFIHAKASKTPPQFSGGVRNFIFFLLPAHISAMAVSMLLFANERLMPIVLATSIAVLSKVLFRVRINGYTRHFLNPSNTGIAILLILFPWVGIAPPYQFTENIAGIPDWILPIIFISVGSLLNTKLTKRIVLILAWFIAFILQATIRSIIFGTPILAALNPMTGVAFLLFSFYMISDPATTPLKMQNQIIFGAAVAFVYGVLVSFHVVFGQFFALLIVCSIRGIYIHFAQSSESAFVSHSGLTDAQKPVLARGNIITVDEKTV